MVANWDRVSFGGDVLELGSGERLHNLVNTLKITELYTLKE